MRLQAQNEQQRLERQERLARERDERIARKEQERVALEEQRIVARKAQKERYEQSVAAKNRQYEEQRRLAQLEQISKESKEKVALEMRRERPSFPKELIAAKSSSWPQIESEGPTNVVEQVADPIILVTLQAHPVMGGEEFARIERSDYETIAAVVPGKGKRKEVILDDLQSYLRETLAPIETYLYEKERLAIIEESYASLRELQGRMLERQEFGFVTDFDALSIDARLASEYAELSAQRLAFDEARRNLGGELLSKVEPLRFAQDVVIEKNSPAKALLEHQAKALSSSKDALAYALAYGATLQIKKDRILTLHQEALEASLRLLESRWNARQHQNEESWIYRASQE